MKSLRRRYIYFLFRWTVIAMILLAGWRMLSSLSRPRPRRPIAIGCTDNLRGLGHFIAMWYLDNDRRYPPDLESLRRKSYFDDWDTRCLHCTFYVYSDDDEVPRYHYTGAGLTRDDLDRESVKRTVLVYCDEKHGMGLIHVLMADFRTVKTAQADTIEEALEQNGWRLGSSEVKSE